MRLPSTQRFKFNPVLESFRLKVKKGLIITARTCIIYIRFKSRIFCNPIAKPNY